MFKQFNFKLFIGGLILLFLPAGGVFASLAKLYISSDHEDFSVTFANHDKEFYQGIELPSGMYKLTVQFPNGKLKKERIYLAPGERRDQVILQSDSRSFYNSGVTLSSGKNSTANVLADVLNIMSLDHMGEIRAEKYKTYLASYASNIDKLTTIDGKTIKDFSLSKSVIEKHASLIGLILKAGSTIYLREKRLKKLASMSDKDAARLKDKLLSSRLTNWASSWYTGKEADFALEDAGRALDISPRSAYAFYQRSTAHEIAGNQRQALDDYETAIQIDPNLAQAYNSMAWLLATTENELLRDGKQAVIYAKKAVQLWPSPNYLDTLAAAYAQSGEWKIAIALVQKAIAQSKDRALFQEYEQHLKAFREHKSWREKAIMPFPDNLFAEEKILKELKAKRKNQKGKKKEYAAFLYKTAPVRRQYDAQTVRPLHSRKHSPNWPLL